MNNSHTDTHTDLHSLLTNNQSQDTNLHLFLRYTGLLNHQFIDFFLSQSTRSTYFKPYQNFTDLKEDVKAFPAYFAILILAKSTSLLGTIILIVESIVSLFKLISSLLLLQKETLDNCKKFAISLYLMTHSLLFIIPNLTFILIQPLMDILYITTRCLGIIMPQNNAFKDIIDNHSVLIAGTSMDNKLSFSPFRNLKDLSQALLSLMLSEGLCLFSTGHISIKFIISTVETLNNFVKLIASFVCSKKDVTHNFRAFSDSLLSTATLPIGIVESIALSLINIPLILIKLLSRTDATILHNSGQITSILPAGISI